MKLTKAEEQVMKYLWKMEEGYMKNILNKYPEPKPATTTVATLLKRMIGKGFVAYKQNGNNRLYFPLIKKTDYFSKKINTLINDFFNNSSSQFVSFFTNETNLTIEELEEIKRIVGEKIEKHNS